MPRLGLWSALPLACFVLACGGGVADRSDAATHAPCTACAEAGASSGGEAGQAGQAGEAGEAGSPAAVKISEVSLWQALRVPLEVGGADVPPNAPIVANKDAILRVYVALNPRFQARELTLALQFGEPGGTTQFSSKKLVRGASEHGDFGSTFNFPIDAARVVAGASYAVRLLDGDAGSELDHYPASELSALTVASAGALHVVVVPIVVGGVMPDVSAEKLAIFQARVLAMYPLSELSITTHAPVTSTAAVGPSAGWDELLDFLYAMRAADAPPDNVFYYGMFTPAKTFGDYCVSDCTVGYSVVTDATDVEDRGSVGLGIFSDGSNSDAPDTMAHELGHALGRDHAPCDVSKQDSGPFPYAGGKIGVWGFDSLNHLLLDPDVYGDVMGYCSPDWISDFTYRAIFQRISQVNAALGASGAKALRPHVGNVRRVLIRHAGRAG